MAQRIYGDRTEAGRTLAPLLRNYTGRKDVVVLGLPRGGIPVAFEAAKALRAPLDTFLVGKLGFPGQEELAMGAVTSGSAWVINRDLVRRAGLSDGELEKLARKRLAELERKEAEYRRGRPPMPLEERTIILVDDGAATGSSMRAALLGLRQRRVAGIVVALPVASRQAVAEIMKEADDVICPLTPEPFQAVGLWYEDFSQVSDKEVAELLDEARSWLGKESEADTGPVTRSPFPRSRSTLRIPAGTATLSADLTLPSNPEGLILFSHGSGSGRLSPRNRQVAEALNRAGFATLLMDLLSPDEDAVDRGTGEFRFDIGLLAGRLVAASHWIAANPDLSHLRLGYFGASTGAAAALMAAARLPDLVSAVVSRGGRPDLAGPSLDEVEVPTLLIVGGADETVLELNREALESLHGGKRLAVIPGATHLFEEPGALEEVSRLAADWFTMHLASETGSHRPHRHGS
ncbi:MAG: Protein-L-isoaspartate O-methyltransferase [Fibrobacteres bacterium]|nr:Protein-L-isoaspartate O-methyltransferase [Fibrobacterota bacterium]